MLLSQVPVEPDKRMKFLCKKDTEYNFDKSINFCPNVHCLKLKRFFCDVQLRSSTYYTRMLTHSCIIVWNYRIYILPNSNRVKL